MNQTNESKKEHTSQEEGNPVVFHAPFTQIIGDVCLGLLLLPILLLPILLFFSTTVTGFIGVGVFAIGAYWVIRNRTGFWTIRIDEQGIQLGSYIFPHRILFEHISLIQCGSLLDKATSMSAAPPLMINVGQKTFHIRLKADQAESCMRLILDKAPEAAGLDYMKVKTGINSLSDVANIINTPEVEIQPKKYQRKNDARLIHAQKLINMGKWFLVVAGAVLVVFPSLESAQLIEFIVVFLTLMGIGLALIGAGHSKRKQILSDKQHR